MNYKRKKYLQQKLHLENIQLNCKFFVIIQLKSMNTSQWASLTHELAKYNFKAKSFSTKLLQKNNSFLPDGLVKVCLARQQKIYNGKIVVLYPTNTHLADIKQMLQFLEGTGLVIPLFSFVDNRFLAVPLLKKIVSTSFEVKSVKVMVFLLGQIMSIVNTLQLINKQK
mmetsp:Transcript_31568/g.80380  ORF Transcript_31568/g.80380 Transcript_31568/m.80380 type:complete len:168 (-) Transcript_31568:421-924(-)